MSVVLKIAQRTFSYHDIVTEMCEKEIIAYDEKKLLLGEKREDEGVHVFVEISESIRKLGLSKLYNITVDFLCKWYAELVGINLYWVDRARDYDNAYLALEECKKFLNVKYLKKVKVLPIYVDGYLSFLISDPHDLEWTLGLPKGLNHKVFFCDPRKIDDIHKSYERNQLKTNSYFSGRDRKELRNLIDITNSSSISSEARLEANEILNWALIDNASDVHIEPYREQSRIRLRIDGVLHTIKSLPDEVTTGVVSVLKVCAGMDITNKRTPQDGRLKISSGLEESETELRLSTMPTPAGEKLVIRIFNPSLLTKNFNDLGFTNRDKRLLLSLLKRAHGIIVVTGPTGSGKTTTLYSCLKLLANGSVNVSTIEDPIEQVDESLSQMQVNHAVDLTFAKGLRTLLRQDPDIIMVGEIRDYETAEAAIQASLTGHLVLTSMHTSSAPGVITRFLDLGVAPYLIKSSLVGVVAQRLLRVLCSNCKSKISITSSEWNDLMFPLRAEKPEHIFSNVGCDFCKGSGYQSRAGVYEIMQVTDSVKRLITQAADTKMITSIAIKEGMIPLRQSGALVVGEGGTSLDELERVVPQENSFLA